MKKKLKEALRLAGLSEELANGISITSEDQIEGIVAALKTTSTQQGSLDYDEILQSEGFTDYVTKNGFDKVLSASKTLQSEHDKKVTQGVQTFRDRIAKGFPGAEKTLEGNKQKMGDDTPEWAKALMSKVDALEAKGQATSKLEQVKALMENSQLPKDFQSRWISRIDLNSETSFEDQIKELETEHADLFKDFVGRESGKGLPHGKGGSDTPSDESIEAVVDNLKI